MTKRIIQHNNQRWRNRKWTQHSGIRVITSKLLYSVRAADENYTVGILSFSSCNSENCTHK